MEIRCVGQRIVVKRLAPEERRGIVIPKDVQKRSLVGKVIHKGPDADWVNVGDIVHFARFSGVNISIDDEHITQDYDECLYMNCEDILGVLEGKPKETAAVFTTNMKDHAHSWPGVKGCPECVPHEEVATV